MTRPPWAGWLPDRVQLVANAAVRAGLIPVVCDDDESIDLVAPGSRPLGCVCDYGVPVLILEETVHDDLMDEDRCVEVRGLAAVLAWVSRAALPRTERVTSSRAVAEPGLPVATGSAQPDDPVRRDASH